MIDGREGFIAVRIFLLKKVFEGLGRQTFRILGVTILPDTATDLFLVILNDLVIFTG
jgi:hypothetical protein